MPEIVFDGKKLHVPPGTNLVEAGLKAGVPVPVFCYHKDLGAVGSCRVCAVGLTAAGKTKVAMACMTAAEDGMEVTTLDRDSVAVRKYVIEWLMEAHPHDCPICDEGGECQLQDLTVAGGHSQRRYTGKKRTFANQFLGEFIVHEMNRCIACYRCSRFYQEYAGGRDFGVTGSRNRVYFGRFEDGPLESPFSGNLVEMCPTGVFTDKLFRYKSRVWDLEIAPSICPHCSVGCNVLPGARHRALQRVRVRENPAVNGVFLCDRGQFGHGYVMDPERPRAIRLDGREADWDDALGLSGGALLGIARQHGAASVALVASTRASVEAHAALDGLASGSLAGVRVSHFDDVEQEGRALAALATLASAGAAPLDQSDLEECDVLVIAGASLVDEAPLAALAARQCARRGGRLFVVGGAEHYLNDVAERVVPAHPAELGATLEAIAGGIGKTNGTADALRPIADALGVAKRPGLLLGCDLLDGRAFTAALALARALMHTGSAARLGCLFPGPNGFGAAAASQGPVLASILADLEAGKLRAMVVVESELGSLTSRQRDALAKLESLIVMDYLAGPTEQTAGVFLPTTATYESEGIYVNRAGRAQAFAPARKPGLSVIQLIDHETFPRRPAKEPPEGLARPAWWVLENLRERAIGTPARPLSEIRRVLAANAFWSAVRDLVPGTEGAVLDLAALGARTADLPAFAKAKDGLAAFRIDRTLGTETLSRRSAPIRKMAGPPVAYLSPADHARLGANGRISAQVNGGSIELEVRASDAVAEGTLLVPRDVDWPAEARQGAAVTVAALATT